MKATTSTQNHNRIPAWTLTQLWSAMQEDIKQCQTKTERTNVEAICCAEMRQKANEWRAFRKLTPMEETICELVGA